MGVLSGWPPGQRGDKPAQRRASRSIEPAKIAGELRQLLEPDRISVGWRGRGLLNAVKQRRRGRVERRGNRNQGPRREPIFARFVSAHLLSRCAELLRQSRLRQTDNDPAVLDTQRQRPIRRGYSAAPAPGAHGRPPCKA